MKKRFAQSGFTLIELLSVMAVIFILMAILLPVMGRMRRAAQRTQCANRIRQLTGAYQQRLEDERKNRVSLDWPRMGELNWRSTLLDYVSLERKVFRCPADPQFASRQDWGTPGGHFFASSIADGRKFGMPFEERLGNPNIETATQQSYFEDIKSRSTDQLHGTVGNTQRRNAELALFDYFVHFADPNTFVYQSPPPLAGLGTSELAFRFRGRYGSSFDFWVTVSPVDLATKSVTVTVEVGSGVSAAHRINGLYFETASGNALWGRPLDQGLIGGRNVEHNRASHGLVHGGFQANNRNMFKLDSEEVHSYGMYYSTWEIAMTRSSYEINPEVLAEGSEIRETWLFRDLGGHHDGQRTVSRTDGSVFREPVP